MRFGDFQYRFRWVPTLLVAFLVALFVGLGLWQLERAEEKRELAEALRGRTELPAFVVDTRITDAEALRFRRLVARGRFEPAGQILLENRRHAGRNGFHVITPLRLAHSDIRVLVNRGWIPADKAGRPTQAPVPEGLIEVRGKTHIPEAPALALHGGPDAAAAWGARWPYLTLDLFAATVDYALQPVVILQDPGGGDGFVRSWPEDPPTPAMHIGYALQWFAFAVIAFLTYLGLSFRRQHDAEERS
jgi:surfeit locus 1 family protein